MTKLSWSIGPFAIYVGLPEECHGIGRFMDHEVDTMRWWQVPLRFWF